MLFRIFHRQTSEVNDRRELLEEAPPSAKEYPRFPRVMLPPARSVRDSFTSLIEKRASERDMDPKRSISLETLSDILHAGAGINRARKRPAEVILSPRYHPSGGALNPLEYYVAALRVSGLPQAIYHYAPEPHALERIISAQAPSAITEASRGLIPPSDPAVAIVMTSVWGRNYPKYGEFAYRLSLIEVGHSAQNILLAATAQGLRSFPLAGFRGDTLRETLDFGNDAEDPLYIVYLGA
ncbi:SagB/ThcOx family dehydrogenase [Candidatus Kaiserbacteria bacterium]|nr:SagB/ThcOx family dehydrogenase [Candidatus Kaiserbacteria bacterium]